LQIRYHALGTRVVLVARSDCEPDPTQFWQLFATFVANFSAHRLIVMSFRRGTPAIKLPQGASVYIQIDESSVTLTPFGSLSRMNPIRVSRRAKSWAAKLRAAFALLFR
jgi:hypothetical protein